MKTEHYRRLRKGEMIKPGDQYCNVALGWIETVMSGKRVGQRYMGGILSNDYRRPVGRKS